MRFCVQGDHPQGDETSEAGKEEKSRKNMNEKRSTRIIRKKIPR
jgi:hypothetical protein